MLAARFSSGRTVFVFCSDSRKTLLFILERMPDSGTKSMWALARKHVATVAAESPTDRAPTKKLTSFSALLSVLLRQKRSGKSGEATSAQHMHRRASKDPGSRRGTLFQFQIGNASFLKSAAASNTDAGQGHAESETAAEMPRHPSLERLLKRMWAASGIADSGVMMIQDYLDYHLSMFRYLTEEEEQEKNTDEQKKDFDFLAAWDAALDDWEDDTDGQEEKQLTYDAFCKSVLELASSYTSSDEPEDQLKFLERLLDGTTIAADEEAAKLAKLQRSVSDIKARSEWREFEIELKWRHRWPARDDDAAETSRRVEALMDVIGGKGKVAKVFKGWLKAAHATDPYLSASSWYEVLTGPKCAGAGYEAVRHGSKNSMKFEFSLQQSHMQLLAVFRYLDADEDGRLTLGDVQTTFATFAKSLADAEAAANKELKKLRQASNGNFVSAAASAKVKREVKLSFAASRLASLGPSGSGSRNQVAPEPLATEP